MIRIGEFNPLTVTKRSPEGFILTDNNGNEAVLFKRDAPENTQPGDEVVVFVYSDAENPFIATFDKPKAKLHEFALLKVNRVSSQGAFLDWGLHKDLFVPFAEQQQKMEEEKNYLVFVFLDEKSGRLAASAKIHRFLDKIPCELEEKQEVQLIVANTTDMGVNIIINNAFKGLVYFSEITRPLKTGERLTGYIREIRPDGKIDVRLRKPGVHEIRSAETILLEAIEAGNGRILLTDKSDPEDIRMELGMSKKTFKQAVGALYKKRQIRLEEDGIYRV